MTHINIVIIFIFIFLIFTIRPAELNVRPAEAAAGVCGTRLTMAANLDKEAYYRRIKRLYGNWKVKM